MTDRRSRDKLVVGRSQDDAQRGVRVRFYFRTTHGERSLEVGPPGTGPGDDWHGFVRPGTQELARAVAVDEDPTEGWMPEDTIRELLDEHPGNL